MVILFKSQLYAGFFVPVNNVYSQKTPKSGRVSFRID